MSKKFCLVSDNDTHLYIIPIELKQEFEEWLEWNDKTWNGIELKYYSEWPGTEFDLLYGIDGFEGQYTFENPQRIN